MLFIALIVGPVVGAKSVQASSILKNLLPTLPLYQPTNGVYNDTKSSMITGTNINSGLSQKTGGAAESDGSPATGAAATTAIQKRDEEFIPRTAALMMPRQTMYMEY